MVRPLFSLMAALAFLSIALLSTVYPSTAQAQEMQLPPMQVGTITMARQAVPRLATLPGRAVAYEQVQLRPRVSGMVEAILYTPGETLSVGDPLFQLDDASYRAAVASNAADLAKAEANLSVAQADYDRAERLEGSGYSSAEVESFRAALTEAQANLDAAQAALEYANTELSWTTITSPIEGVAEVANVSVGDLVTGAQSDPLTVITRLDPIEVDMLEASAKLLSLRTEITDGTLQMSDHIDATLVLENGQTYQGRGELVASSNFVSTTTGTFTARFRFDNPDGLILPGMFLRGEVRLGTINAFLVPQRAAKRGSGGTLNAFIVGEDNTALLVNLTEVGTYQNNWIVTSGLSEGDRLIVDGLKSLQAAQQVQPVAAVVDEAGLIQDITTETPDEEH